MKAECHMQAAVGRGPYDRRVVLVALEALGVNLNTCARQEHAWLGELALGKVIGTDPRQALVAAPDSV